MIVIDLVARISKVEQRMDAFEGRLESAVASLGTQILQVRDEMRVSFSAMRGEMAEMKGSLEATIVAGDEETQRSLSALIVAGDDETRRSLGAVIVAGDEETRRSLSALIVAGDDETRRALSEAIAEGDAASRHYMRILIEDVRADIKLLGEGRQ